MDSVFGVTGNGFAILASDMAIARSILVYKHDVDKILQLDSHKIMVGAGTQADNVNFGEYIQKNFKLYDLRNSIALDTKSGANMIRNEVGAFVSPVDKFCLSFRPICLLFCPPFSSNSLPLCLFVPLTPPYPTTNELNIAAGCGSQEGAVPDQYPHGWVRRGGRGFSVLD
jgi:hypothetical protein